MKAIYKPKGKAEEYAPWACNLYRGCTHGCLYCYAPSVLRMNRQEFHTGMVARPVFEALAKEAPKHAQEHPGEPVLLCFTSDPYPHGGEHAPTHHAIGTLVDAGVPVHVLTKGGCAATNDFDLLARVPGSAFATTITTMHSEQAARWEPGAATPMARLFSLRIAKSRGLRTWLSLEPVIDHEAALEVIRRAAPFVDEFRVGKLNYHPRSKEIDWPAFREEAVALLEHLGQPYYIKKDLREA